MSSYPLEEMLLYSTKPGRITIQTLVSLNNNAAQLLNLHAPLITDTLHYIENRLDLSN